MACGGCGKRKKRFAKNVRAKQKRLNREAENESGKEGPSRAERIKARQERIRARTARIAARNARMKMRSIKAAENTQEDN